MCRIAGGSIFINFPDHRLGSSQEKLPNAESESTGGRKMSEMPSEPRSRPSECCRMPLALQHFADWLTWMAAGTLKLCTEASV